MARWSNDHEYGKAFSIYIYTKALFMCPQLGLTVFIAAKIEHVLKKNKNAHPVVLPLLPPGREGPNLSPWYIGAVVGVMDQSHVLHCGPHHLGGMFP